MPWKDTTTMEQKVEFICEWNTGNTPSQSYVKPSEYRVLRLTD
jgi:hypothetical protein